MDTTTSPSTSQSSAPIASQTSSIAAPSASATQSFTLPSAISQSSSGSFNPVLSSFPPSLSQETTASGTTTGSTLIDTNAPELFKQNVQIAMEQVARVNVLARNALNGVQNAYQAGVNPAQTKADITALDQALHALADFLRQSGVGAYPLPMPRQDGVNATPPTEQQLLADTTRGVQQLYDGFKRMQESSSVVANLMAVQESSGRAKAWH